MMTIEAIWRPENQQGIFRVLMEAMARPGSLHPLGSLLGGVSCSRGVLASLLDTRTTLADCHDLLDPDDWLLFQACKAAAEKADYLLCDGNLPFNVTPKIGTLSCPDHSATLIIQVARLGTGKTTLLLRGPGIEKTTNLLLEGLDLTWLEYRQELISFPLGIDMILVDRENLAAIPRTSNVKDVS